MNNIKKQDPPIVIIAGWSGSGKTTLVEKLIPVLKKSALKVGTIKHHHGDFEFDTPGKDSWRHKQAGAEKTIVSSPVRIGIVMDAHHDHMPNELIHYLSDVDIIIVEGFKAEKLPKVEIFRSEMHDKPRFLNDPNLIAIMTDANINADVPEYNLDDVEGLADFLIESFELVKG